MKKLTIILFSSLILSACVHSLPPEPKSWKNDLSGIKEEQINTDKQMLNDVMTNKDVWSK